MNLFICNDKKFYLEVWCIIGSTVNCPHQNNNISSISLKVTIVPLGQWHASKIIYVHWVYCTWSLLYKRRQYGLSGKICFKFCVINSEYIRLFRISFTASGLALMMTGCYWLMIQK